jgi:hypothetical protein
LSKPEPGETGALNSQVAAEIKKNFKIGAAVQGITQSELSLSTFSEWQAKEQLVS